MGPGGAGGERRCACEVADEEDKGNEVTEEVEDEDNDDDFEGARGERTV